MDCSPYSLDLEEVNEQSSLSRSVVSGATVNGLPSQASDYDAIGPLDSGLGWQIDSNQTAVMVDGCNKEQD